MKNIFVLFSPGTGGNHFANMLSTDTRFNQRTTVSDYKAHDRPNAHTSKFKNLQPAGIKKLPAEGNVLCGHLGEYYWLNDSGLLRKFCNKQLFILEVPQCGTIAWNRWNTYNQFDKSHTYLREEQRSLYTIKVIEMLFRENDIVSLSCELLFQSDLTKLFNLISSQSDISLNKDACNSMHKIWLEKIMNQNHKKG